MVNLDTKKKIFRVNDDGYGWDEDLSNYVTKDMRLTVERPYTLVNPPNPSYKPFFNWDTEEWEEHATEEEIAEIMSVDDAEDPQETIEKYKKMLDDLLNKEKPS